VLSRGPGMVMLMLAVTVRRGVRTWLMVLLASLVEIAWVAMRGVVWRCRPGRRVPRICRLGASVG
jgi:endonuclease/exonuclease/phosphatase (EEP) superfamily protein YafD